MMAYVGQTRSKKLIAQLIDLGIGEMTVRGEYPPCRQPWAYDNGAYRDWKAGVPFNERDFLADIYDIYDIHGYGDLPDFIVAPDIVAGGDESIDVSVDWAERLDGIAPLYLAVQDGMTVDRVTEALPHFSGLFVGGTLPWKLSTGQQWVKLAHRNGMSCHVGRVGTARRVRWAERIGVDSVDSCLPLWSKDNLRVFLEAFDHPQQELFAHPVTPGAQT